MTPEELLAAGCNLYSPSAGAALTPTRAVAASLLYRQALETALHDFWSARVPGLDACSGRVQLVSLPFYVDDPEVSVGASYAWYRLSAVCHHDAYELPPDGAELTRLAQVVGRVVTGLQAA